MQPNLQYCTGSPFAINMHDVPRSDNSRDVNMLRDFMANKSEARLDKEIDTVGSRIRA